jgi:hypothetical protein
MEQAAAWAVREIRLVNEPFHTAESGIRGLAGLISPNLLKWLALRALSRCRRNRLRRRDFSFPERSLGVLFSGGMTAPIVERGLRRIVRRSPAADAEVEVLFHPGPAYLGDRDLWRENPRQARFYYSPRRAAETAALLSPELRRSVEAISSDSVRIEEEE